MEGRGQHFHQLPEVHPLVGGEEEKDFAAVEGALGADQLHIQPQIGDLLLAEGIGLLFSRLIVLQNALVPGGGLPQHGPQGGHQRGRIHLMDAGSAGAEFRTAGGIDNDMVPGGKGQAVGVKKVDLLARAELDVHHLPLFFFHLFFHECLLYFRRAKNSQPHTAAGETLP